MTIKNPKFVKINCVNPTNESKEIEKNMKNYGIKSEIKLRQYLKTHMILMKSV